MKKLDRRMTVFTDPDKLQVWCRTKRQDGRVIALVPTMGYIHEGHLSLIAAAKKKGADEIVVSVFVNPMQFGPKEDIDKYPRDGRGDMNKCREAGATAIFFPRADDMYLKDHSVYVNEESLSKGLCGARRPGHFRGVCTVVAKLFNISHAHFAVFGQKDYQQVQVIKRMVRDLNFDVKIYMAPIVREESGLAMSSRNTYLSDEEKAKAVVISQTLRDVRGGRVSLANAKKALEKAGLKVDYVEGVNGETLEPVKKLTKGCAVLIAAYCGKTRLIDNCVIC